MRWCIILLLTGAIFPCHGQKYDYIWLSGYQSGGYDSTAPYNFGISNFNFNQQPVSIIYDSLGINFTGTNADISDGSGHLLFYTNGITIRNSFDEIIENGDSLNDGYCLNNLPLWYYFGNPLYSLMQVLPNPVDSNLYDLFYVFADTDYLSKPTGKKLLCTQVQMDSNFGKGIANFKDRAVDSQYISISLCAVKHANGRDWWLCTMAEETNCYNLYLYNGRGYFQLSVQDCGGFVFHRAEASTLRFSSDGKWLMSTDNEQGRVDFFQFDRCAGTLTLKEDIYLSEVVDSNQEYIMLGSEFSPNSRYAYVCENNKLLQYDMNALPISSSKTVVGVYNADISLGPLTYNYAQLGPDGKIYICSANTINYIAVINEPDSAGVACRIQDSGFKIPSIIHCLPYYPNYRLGVAVGSACDTIAPNGNNEQVLKVFPNPAYNVVTIDYGFTDWSKGQPVLEICNILGQKVYIQSLPTYSGFQNIDVSMLSPGIYLVYVRQAKSILAADKLVKNQ